jgi:hypothetical protein
LYIPFYEIFGLELFHLDLDPAEKYNRAEEKPAIVERLTAQLEAMAQTTDSQRTWK